MADPGRPSKLTEKVKKDLIAAISRGLPYSVSCEYAGISYSSFNRWMKRGEEEKEGEYWHFCNEIKRVQVEAEIQLLEAIRVDESWQSKAWILERRHPDRYGKRERVDLEINNPITFQVVGRSRDERTDSEQG